MHIDKATWSVGETKTHKRPVFRAAFDEKAHYWGAKMHLEKIGLKPDGNNNYLICDDKEWRIKVVGEKTPLFSETGLKGTMSI